MFFSKAGLLVAFALSFPAVCAEQIKLLVENYPPYIENQHAQKGVITQLVVEAFKRKQIGSDIKFATWSQVESNVDNDRALSFMWNKTKPRLKKWHFSEPIYVQKKTYLAHRDFAHDISLVHDLRGIKLGLTQGFDYGAGIERLRSKLSIAQFNSDYMTVKNLLDKKVELIVIDPMIAVDLMNKYFSHVSPSSLSFIDTAHFQGVPYYLVCAKRYGNCMRHIKNFNQGLAILQQEGITTALLKRAETL